MHERRRDVFKPCWTWGIDPRELEKEKQEAKEAKKAADETAKKQKEAKKKYTLKALIDEYADYCEAQGKTIYAGAVRSATKCHLTEVDPDLAGTPAKRYYAETRGRSGKASVGGR